MINVDEVSSECRQRFQKMEKLLPNFMKDQPLLYLSMAEVEIAADGVVGFYHQGMYFGEASLMRGEPRAATIRATETLQVLHNRLLQR